MSVHFKFRIKAMKIEFNFLTIKTKIMKTKKRVLGLTLCLGMLLSISMLQNNISANAGWAIAKAFETNEAGVVAFSTAGGAYGGYVGAEIGATIGASLGPIGIIGGAVIGGL